MKKAITFFILLVIILTVSPATYAQDHAYPDAAWTPVPTGTEYLSGIWGTSGSDIFAVGDIGVVLHYDGKAWTPMSSGTHNPLSKVWGSSGNDVFAVGYEGTIIHYDGSQWEAMNSGTDEILLDVWGSSGSDVFAVGEHGTILHYDGVRWEAMNSGTQDVTLHGVWGSSGSDVFAVGDNGTILHYNGSGWSLMDSGEDKSLYSIWGRSGSDVFAVGDETILHYDGRKWSLEWSLEKDVSSNIEYIRFHDLWTGPGSRVFALGDGGDKIAGYTAEYDSSEWIFKETEWRFLGIWGHSAENEIGAELFAVGYGGVILHYGDSEWTVIRQGIDEKLTSIWGSSETDIFIVGYNGTILHYDGTVWTPMNSGIDTHVQGVWGNSGTDVFAVGSYGTILHYDSTAWTPMNSGTDKRLKSVWGNSATDVFAVGDSGTILHYDGFTWTPMKSGTRLWLISVWGSSGTDVFAADFYGKILHYDGSAWAYMDGVHTDHNFIDVWGISGSNVFASGSKGTIMHYDGAVWSSMDTGAEEILTDISGCSESDIFAVGGKGTVLHYDGTAWTEMNSLTNIYLRSVWVPQTSAGPGSDIFFSGDYGMIRHFRYSALGLTFPGSVREGENTVRGEVRVRDAVTDDLTISLVSGDPSEISVPETVAISSGSTSASFDIIISDDKYPDGTQQVSVTASARGYFSSKTVIPVHDNETSVIRVNLPPDIREGDTGITGEIKLCLPDPECGDLSCDCIPVTAAKDISIYLSSDDASEISVPKQVIVPAGESGALFDVTIEDDEDIDDIQSASVSAWVDGWPESNKVLTVQDNDRYLISVTIPNNMTEGDPVMKGTAYLSEPFPSDVTISLSSGDTSELVVSPSMITVPAGSISADFEMTALEDGMPDNDRIVALRASAPGWKSAGAAVSERSAELRAYRMNWNPADAAVRIRDADQKPIIMRHRPDFEAVWGNSGTDIFALGKYKSVLHYDGSEWTSMYGGTKGSLHGAWGHASENGLRTGVFAVGGRECIILHYDGKEWLPMEAGSDAIYPILWSLSDVWGYTTENGLESEVFAVGLYGRILHYDGSKWLPMDSGTDQDIEAVWGCAGQNSMDIFAVGKSGTILHYDGNAWHLMESGTDRLLTDIWGYTGENGPDIFAVGSSGTILRYDGHSWNTMDSGTEDRLEGVWGYADESGDGIDVFAAGRDGTLLHYDGVSWNPMESGTDEHLLGIWGYASEDKLVAEVFAAGRNGTIIRYDGTAWNSVEIPYEEMALRDIWCLPEKSGLPREAFAVGDDGVILHYAGDAWTRSGTGTDWHMNLSRVWGSPVSQELTDAARVFAVGELGTILHYDGEEWHKTENITDKNLKDIRGNSHEDVYAVGGGGIILHYDGDGWTTQESGTGTGLNGVWCTPAGADSCSRVFAVGNSGVILHRSCHETLEDVPTWKVMESGTEKNLNAVWGSSATDVFAAGDDDTILHYDGKTWQQMDTGVDESGKFSGVWGSRSENGLGIRVFAVGERSVLYYDGAEWTEINESVYKPRGVSGRSGGEVFIVGETGSIAYYSSLMLSVPRTAAEGAGTLQGTVRIPASQDADLAVKLTSLSPSEISVPQTVTIPAGRTTADFDLSVADDALADGTQAAYIIATVPGHKFLNGARAEIRITDNETPVLSVSLPETAEEGGEITGLVSMSEPAGKEIAVSLAPGDMTVTIPRGETSAEFRLILNEDNEFDGTETAAVTASVENWTSGTASLSVSDNEVPELALGIPETVSETDSLLTGTVSIPGTFPEDVRVSLVSDDLSEITVPGSVVIPAGEISAPFDLTLTDDPEIDGTQTVTLTASADGWTSAEAAIEVGDNDPGILQFATDRHTALKSDGQAVITVIRTGSTQGKITTDYIAEESPGGKTGYPRTEGTLAFAHGETEKTFPLPLVPGYGNGTVWLSLVSSGGGASLGTPHLADLIIADRAEWKMHEPLTDAPLRGIWGSSYDNVYAAGWRGVILRYDGTAWNPVSHDAGESVFFEAVWGSSPSDIRVAGQAGVILHYDGTEWTFAESGTDAALYALWGSSATDVYAGGAGLILHWDGTAWTKTDIGTDIPPHITGMWGSAASDIFAVGYEGLILHYDGTAWTKMNSGTETHLFGIWGTSPSDVFAAGTFGTLLHFDGARWTQMNPGTEEFIPFLETVWGTSPENVYAAGAFGTLLHFDGREWKPAESGTERSLNALWGASPHDILAVGDSGTVLDYGPAE
ncbi:Calx-beta domain-containing protein [Desulfobacterales bacterium HSG2]|nr:Calx-beta domain-containing protein [Desulfobacterales bacterium HSG2]